MNRRETGVAFALVAGLVAIAILLSPFLGPATF